VQDEGHPDVVYVVVDPAFGARLSGLPRGVPVWIVDTPTNRRAVEAHRKAHAEPNHFTGMTTFKPGGDTPAECVLAILRTVDEHHPHWRELRIIGAAADDGAVGGLRDFGVTSVSDQPEGLFAVR
jgi:hypothetical protein